MVMEVRGVDADVALGSDALTSLALCGAKARRIKRQQRRMNRSGHAKRFAQDGQTTTDPRTGRETVEIRSMDSLRRVLSGGM